MPSPSVDDPARRRGRPARTGGPVVKGSMRAAQFDRYGKASEVLAVRNALPVPAAGAEDVLIEVVASSVNPIDCAVRDGYGRVFFEHVTGERPPMRPGRDVAGRIVSVGSRVTGFEAGQEVYAATLGGANAEFVRVPASWVALKPRTLDWVDAASLPYVALTSWTALVTHGGLSATNAGDKHVIVPRAAGGVGTFATQLAKAWGARVTAICSTRNVDLVRDLGADRVIDYQREDPARALYGLHADIAFDTSFDTEDMLLDALAVDADAAYVSIVTPKLKLIDELGLEEGLRRGEALLAAKVAEQRGLGRRYYWSFAQPSGVALREIAALVDAGRIRAIVDRKFSLEDVVAAHEYCESGRAQGKIAVLVSDEAR